MAFRTSMSVIPVARGTVTNIEVIAILSDIKVAVVQEITSDVKLAVIQEITSDAKVAVVQEIASKDDEGVAIASDHAVLEVVLVPAATVQDHVIAKGQKGHDQKIVIEAEEIEEVDLAITSNHAVLEVVLVPAATV